ncbi:MAG: hypothetical protein AAEJ59_01500 [Arenicellales bacterium]
MSTGSLERASQLAGNGFCIDWNQDRKHQISFANQILQCGHLYEARGTG